MIKKIAIYGKGGIGKSTVKFYVTNHGTAVLSICDRYNNVVYHYSYDDFNTWEQSFVWRGTGYEDEKLPDGVYTIVLDSVEGFHFEQNVTIDTSLVYPLLSYTLAGSGVGTLPFGFVSDVNFVMPFIQCGVSYNYVENLDFAGVPLTTGILFDFAKNFEIGFSCNWNIGYMEGQTPFGFNFNFKGTIKSPVDSNAAICFTPNIHYGYNSMPESVPLSYDTGAGLGLGLSADYDSQNLFAGASFNYVFDTTHEKNMRNNIIKYGAALGYKFSTGSKISAWGAIHNSEVYEAGVELVSMPGSSACCIDTKIWAIKQNENKSSVCAQIGLSYLF